MGHNWDRVQSNRMKEYLFTVTSFVLDLKFGINVQVTHIALLNKLKRDIKDKDPFKY